jgi:hypothetical protein
MDSGFLAALGPGMTGGHPRVDTLPYRPTLKAFRGELRQELRDREAETL